MVKGGENVIILNHRRGQIKEMSVKRKVPDNVLHSFIQLQVHIFKLLILTYHPPHYRAGAGLQFCSRRNRVIPLKSSCPPTASR